MKVKKKRVNSGVLLGSSQASQGLIRIKSEDNPAKCLLMRFVIYFSGRVIAR